MDQTDLYLAGDRLEQALEHVRQAGILLAKDTPLASANAALDAGAGVAHFLEQVQERVERATGIVNAEISRRERTPASQAALPLDADVRAAEQSWPAAIGRAA